MVGSIISILIVYIIYYGLNQLTERIVKNEYLNATNRISKTKIIKTISRRNELYDYEFALNPNLEKLSLRLLAKVIDFVFYLIIFYSLKSNIEILKIIPFFIAFMSLFLLNPLFEFLTGKTVGKFSLGLEVIDDTARKPSFLISYLKNLLQLGLIFIYISSYSSFWEDELFFHNQKTLTYTIKSKDKKTIAEQIKAS